jgi:hypothetical protein
MAEINRKLDHIIKLLTATAPVIKAPTPVAKAPTPAAILEATPINIPAKPVEVTVFAPKTKISKKAPVVTAE